MNSPRSQLLLMLKALADESRLSILLVLLRGEMTVGELAQKISLGEPTVSHHLTRLREAGFVSLRAAGNQRFYRSNDSGLTRFKKLAANIENIPIEEEVKVISDDGWIDALDWQKAELQVLREHTCSGKLTHLPAKQKKMLVILRWLATLFETERLYNENEVNEILKAVYAEDFISLRRDLVDFGYLRRERGGGKYWLAPANEQG